MGDCSHGVTVVTAPIVSSHAGAAVVAALRDSSTLGDGRTAPRGSCMLG